MPRLLSCYNEKFSGNDFDNVDDPIIDASISRGKRQQTGVIYMTVMMIVV